MTLSQKAREERAALVAKACDAVTGAMNAEMGSRGLLFVLTVLDPETGLSVVRSNGTRLRVRECLEDCLAAVKAGFGVGS